MESEQLCHDPHEPNTAACIDKARADNEQCFTNAGFTLSKRNTWLTLGLYAIGAWFWAYIAAFVVRGSVWIVIWIRQGFRKET